VCGSAKRKVADGDVIQIEKEKIDVG